MATWNKQSKAKQKSLDEGAGRSLFAHKFLDYLLLILRSMIDGSKVTVTAIRTIIGLPFSRR